MNIRINFQLSDNEIISTEIISEKTKLFLTPKNTHKDKDVYTAFFDIYYAAKKRDFEKLISYIRNGHGLGFNYHGCNPIILLAAEGDTETIDFLMNMFGIHINPDWIACGYAFRGHFEGIQKMIGLGANFELIFQYLAMGGWRNTVIEWINEQIGQNSKILSFVLTNIAKNAMAGFARVSDEIGVSGLLKIIDDIPKGQLNELGLSKKEVKKLLCEVALFNYASVGNTIKVKEFIIEGTAVNALAGSTYGGYFSIVDLLVDKLLLNFPTEIRPVIEKSRHLLTYIIDNARINNIAEVNKSIEQLETTISQTILEDDKNAWRDRNNMIVLLETLKSLSQEQLLSAGLTTQSGSSLLKQLGLNCALLGHAFAQNRIQVNKTITAGANIQYEKIGAEHVGCLDVDEYLRLNPTHLRYAIAGAGEAGYFSDFDRLSLLHNDINYDVIGPLAKSGHLFTVLKRLNSPGCSTTTDYCAAISGFAFTGNIFCLNLLLSQHTTQIKQSNTSSDRLQVFFGDPGDDERRPRKVNYVKVAFKGLKDGNYLNSQECIIRILTFTTNKQLQSLIIDHAKAKHIKLYPNVQLPTNLLTMMRGSKMNYAEAKALLSIKGVIPFLLQGSALLSIGAPRNLKERPRPSLTSDMFWYLICNYIMECQLSVPEAQHACWLTHRSIYNAVVENAKYIKDNKKRQEVVNKAYENYDRRTSVPGFLPSTSFLLFGNKGTIERRITLETDHVDIYYKTIEESCKSLLNSPNKK